MKRLFKKFIPPIFLELLKKPSKYGYFGNYKNWHEAGENAAGYDSSAILEKVKNSLLKVKNGEAVYERDSVIFHRKEYAWPVLAGLLWAALEGSSVTGKNTLNVLDFGGSLGSSYFQNREFLKHIDLKWYILEQKNFVECGKKFFENEELKFLGDINEVKDKNISVFLASSSIHYIESPYEYMKKVIDLNFPFIIIDRTLFLKNSERITVQKVRPDVYDASYPAWFLNEEKFLNLFKGKYTLVSDFESIGRSEINLGDQKGYFRGFLFKKN